MLVEDTSRDDILGVGLLDVGTFGTEGGRADEGVDTEGEVLDLTGLRVGTGGCVGLLSLAATASLRAWILSEAWLRCLTVSLLSVGERLPGLLMLIAASCEAMSAVLSVGGVRGTAMVGLMGITVARWAGQGIREAAARARMAVEQKLVESAMDVRKEYIVNVCKRYPMKRKKEERKRKLGGEGGGLSRPP